MKSTETVPISQLWTFAIARGFRDQKGNEFKYEKNRLEQVGTFMRWGIGSAADFIFREFKNPIVIVALTAIGLFAVTIAFYPAVALGIIAKVCPIALSLKPWMVKMALYLLVQSTVLGVGVRAFGRLSNASLTTAWRENQLTPIYPGDKRIS